MSMTGLEQEHEQKAIYCYVHDCNPLIKQLSRMLLTRCKLCHEPDGLSTPLRLLTKVCNPFYDANKIKCDLVITSTTGLFQLKNKFNLHIGICDNYGHILEFDRSGLHYNNPNRADNWKQCLKLNFLQAISDHKDKLESLQRDWSTLMTQMRSTFSREFHDDIYNCLDFVLEFLQNFLSLIRTTGSLDQQVICDISESIRDKETFCSKFVVRETSEAAKYIVLNSKLQSNIELVAN